VPAGGVQPRLGGRPADSLTALGACRRRSGKADVEPEVPEPEIEHPAACHMHYPGQQDKGKTISTSHAKNSTTPGMARPATVLAMAASCPPAQQLIAYVTALAAPAAQAAVPRTSIYERCGQPGDQGRNLRHNDASARVLSGRFHHSAWCLVVKTDSTA